MKWKHQKKILYLDYRSKTESFVKNNFWLFSKFIFRFLSLITQQKLINNNEIEILMKSI